jgi:hypothetical protein
MRTHPTTPGCRSTRHVRQGGISENRTIIDNRTLFIESYLPHSGSVFPELAEELAGYEKSSGALRFAVDQPLPPELVEKLIAVRLRQAFPQLRGDVGGSSGVTRVSKRK